MNDGGEKSVTTPIPEYIKKKAQKKYPANTRNMCGNSMIILPDKKFIFVPSDPHFDAINFTNEETSSFPKNK